MEMSNAKKGAIIKRVARNVLDIIKQKERLKEKIAKLNEEIEQCEKQQAVFEGPIKEMTGGYGIEDLVTIEAVDVPVTKEGQPTRRSRITKISLKYPDTIVPPETLELKIDAETLSGHVAYDDELPFN